MSQPSVSPDSGVAAATVPASLQQAAQAFFPDLIEAAVVPGHPNILKVTAPSGLWRVRGWPETTPANDIRFSHEVMSAARQAGLLVIPELKPLPGEPERFTVRLDGRVYDAQQWLPGKVQSRAETTWPGEDDRIELPAAIAPEVFAEVIAAIARLHEATAPIAKRKGVPDAPLRLLPGAVRQAHRHQLAAVRSKAGREPAIQRWLATGERLMARAEPIVAAAAEDGRLASGVLHLGLWPAHVLIAEDHLSGLLGWERVAAGSPVLDIAQATLRLQGWRDEAVEMAVATYGDTSPLSPDERRLLLAVAALDAVATTGRLLEQTYGTAETARPPAVLRSAVDMMQQSMTAIERGLNEPAKPRRTPWRRAASGPRRREGGTTRDRHG